MPVYSGSKILVLSFLDGGLTSWSCTQGNPGNPGSSAECIMPIQGVRPHAALCVLMVVLLFNCPPSKASKLSEPGPHRVFLLPTPNIAFLFCLVFT